MALTQTRVQPLALAQMSPGHWQFIDTTDGDNSQVGPIYKSKAEALADLDRYSRDGGWVKSGTQQAIETEWLDDSYDCETCGPSYADGAIVKIGGAVALDLTPHAHCYSGSNYSQSDVYKAILEHLGYQVAA